MHEIVSRDEHRVILGPILIHTTLPPRASPRSSSRCLRRGDQTLPHGSGGRGMSYIPPNECRHHRSLSCHSQREEQHRTEAKTSNQKSNSILRKILNSRIPSSVKKPSKLESYDEMRGPV